MKKRKFLTGKRFKKTIEKYGSNIHQATLRICREIGLSDKILGFVEDLEWNNVLKFLKEENFASSLLIYCDMRIGPFGILSLKERIKNLQTRNKSHDFASVIKAADLLEKTLQKYLSISVNSIDNPQINRRFKDLLKLEIK